ncbi:hypothetical protein TWF730_011301 [Orbilia blumenaviensis]|uniref:Uncharacterized protein n=1 Tax=Orbilia blumenaviensis TaxID=1796055 RepID=A0AAV9UNQ2_9PEZI
MDSHAAYLSTLPSMTSPMLINAPLGAGISATASNGRRRCFPSIDVTSLKSTTVVNASGRQKVKYKLDYVVKMKIGSADALFSIWLDNKCIGRARISHDKDDDEFGLVSSQLGKWLDT